MKLLGNFELAGEAGGAFKSYSEFPLNPKVGTWALIQRRLMVCVENVDMEVPVWVPITQERNTYVHPQDTSGTTWSIPHGLDTETLIVQCYDNQDNVINPSSIKVVDRDTAEVSFTDAVAGRAIVMYGYEDGGLTEGNISGGNSTSGLPIGMLADFPSRRAIAEGFIPLDGQTIYATQDPELVKLLAGDNATEVTLPDINGQKLFYRGGASDLLPFGRKQNDTIRNITGELAFHGIYEGGNGGTPLSSVDGAFEAEAIQSNYSTVSQGQSATSIGISKFDASNVVPTADENRPVNTSVVRCIKAHNTQIVGEEVDVESLKNRIKELEAYPSPWVYIGDENAPEFLNGTHSQDNELGIGYQFTSKNQIHIYGIARHEGFPARTHHILFEFPEEIKSRLPNKTQFGNCGDAGDQSSYSHISGGAFSVRHEAEGQLPVWIMADMIVRLDDA